MTNKTLISGVPSVVNAGIDIFSILMKEAGARVIDLPWKPPLGGDLDLYRRLFGLGSAGPSVARLEIGNARVVKAMLEADPVAIDLVPAASVMPALQNRMLLHAGPPLDYARMTDTMRGAAAGALLFEGWAKDREEAELLLASGSIPFDSCHHHGAVGPMVGIISPSMPVFVVKDSKSGRCAYSTINEGIGAVMRFGASGPEVIERLQWFASSFGPLLGAALRRSGGLPLKPLMAKALLMGDEMHQRNTAASLLFCKELMPHLVAVGSGDDLERAVGFLLETEQFFLNLAMCAGKIMGDSGQLVGEGSIVTAMCRNGVDFGIRVSGLGDRWWTAPVNTPTGLYFAGFSGEDASPDLGDSAILETVALGGMALPAAPAVLGFVGAGTFKRGVELFERLQGFTVSINPAWTIPALDGRAVPFGIDIRQVVATGIEPLINTGIAHKQAGRGQIGAGTVTAPLGCFEAACRELGVKLEG
ncbi:DUF1116 domain-containing protein [Treponema sp.]